MAHIAQQTLGFYRDNSRPVILPVSQLVADVLTVYRRKLEYKGIQIEEQIEPGVTTHAGGELKQVLSILIANAIDASSDGGHIIVRARSSRNLRSGLEGIRITVADNGFGIPRDIQTRLFLPFFTTKKDVGTGLGLAIRQGPGGQKGGEIRFRSPIARLPVTIAFSYPDEATKAAYAFGVNGENEDRPRWPDAGLSIRRRSALLFRALNVSGLPLHWLNFTPVAAALLFFGARQPRTPHL